MALRSGYYGLKKRMISMIEQIVAKFSDALAIKSIGTGLILDDSGELSADGTGVVDYSTTEVNTGRKWIDGKDVYMKVISGDAVPTNGATLIEGVDTVINAYGSQLYTGDSNPRWYCYPFTGSAQLRYELIESSHTLTMLNGASQVGAFKYVFEYTKVSSSRSKKKGGK